MTLRLAAATFPTVDSSGAPPKDGLQPAETEQRYEFCVLLDISAWTGKRDKPPLTCPKCEAQLTSMGMLLRHLQDHRNRNHDMRKPPKDEMGEGALALSESSEARTKRRPRKCNISSSKMNVGAPKDDGDGDDGGVNDLDRPNDDIDTD
ncbi:hypothetical protein AB5N19_03509 [Seiridium cardinale]